MSSENKHECDGTNIHPFQRNAAAIFCEITSGMPVPQVSDLPLQRDCRSETCGTLLFSLFEKLLLHLFRVLEY